MPHATCLYHFQWRKKKADKFIIPATYYRNSGYSITEVKPKVEITQPSTEISTENKAISNPEAISVAETSTEEPVQTSTIPVVETKIVSETPKITMETPVSVSGGVKVSALSLASIKAKRELEASQKASVKHHDELPKEPFTETDMLLHWVNFAEKLKSKGQHIMATYMLMDDPTLEGTTIKLHLPNEGSKVDFDNNKNDLLGYLRGHLHNHDVAIEVHVNEVVENKYAFTPIEKYEKLKAINPALELLKKTFDLYV